MSIFLIIYIIALEIVMFFVGVPFYKSSGLGSEVSISFLPFLISLFPPLLIFLFSLVKKDFLITCFPLTLGLCSSIYYLRFSFADEFLLGSLIISTLFCKYNAYLKRWDDEVSIYASNIFKILICLSIYSAFLGLFYRDIRIIKSILFVTILSLAWTQRRKIYGLIFNPKAPFYVLSGYCLALITNIFHGILQILYNPLIFKFGSVDGALGIQGPHIGAPLPFIFIYLILVQKRFILPIEEKRKIDNLIYFLSPLVLLISLITDSRTILLFYFLSITSYLLTRLKWNFKIPKKFILVILAFLFLFIILIFIGNNFYGDPIYFVEWIFNLFYQSFKSIIGFYNLGDVDNYDLIYQGNIRQTSGDFGRLVFLVHGLLTPILHPITILSGLGDYSFFIYAKESLDRVSILLSGNEFLNTLGYTIGNTSEIRYPKPPIIASVFLEKGFLFSIILFEYIRLIVVSLINSHGFLIAMSFLFCILISFISANFEDNLSIILLVGPPLITLNPKNFTRI